LLTDILCPTLRIGKQLACDKSRAPRPRRRPHRHEQQWHSCQPQVSLRVVHSIAPSASARGNAALPAASPGQTRSSNPRRDAEQPAMKRHGQQPNPEHGVAATSRREASHGQTRSSSPSSAQQQVSPSPRQAASHGQTRSSNPSSAQQQVSPSPRPRQAERSHQCPRPPAPRGGSQQQRVQAGPTASRECRSARLRW